MGPKSPTLAPTRHHRFSTDNLVSIAHNDSARDKIEITKQAEPPKPTQPQLCAIDKHRHALLQMPLTVDLSVSTVFRHTRHIFVPKKGGVYLIHDLRGVLYVGRTRNLYRRFGEHYWLTDNERLSRHAAALRRNHFQLDDRRGEARTGRA